ncbi:hypothetical protein DFH09DRAFT_1322297 [Mycena vulgaris]|nr:hypothetical protein DFH09DRAFT_1322297 [Mycena vulgaris]
MDTRHLRAAHPALLRCQTPLRCRDACANIGNGDCLVFPSRSSRCACALGRHHLAYNAERGGGGWGWDTIRAVYRCVHAWRDTVSRADEESTQYVLPNHYLLQPAERPPMDISALLQMLQSVPPVRRRGRLDHRRSKKKKWQVATEGEGESEEGNPFDFPTVPNILDDVPNREDMRVKKKERRNL